MPCQLPSEMFVILQDTRFSFLYIMQPGDNLNTTCKILVTVMFIILMYIIKACLRCYVKLNTL